MSASGGYGPRAWPPASSAFADLCLGAAVREVLEAHIGAAARALSRHPPCRRLACQRADPQLAQQPRASTCCASPSFREGFAQLAPLGLSFDAWLFHPQIAELTELAQRLPRHRHRARPLRRAAGHRPLCRAGRSGVRRLEARHRRAGALPQRGGQARRPGDADQRLRLAQARAAAELAATGRRHARATTCTPSSASAPSAACSRATSRWTRCPARTWCCGTASSAWRPASARPRRPRCSTTRPCACTGSTA